jgi:hypothetical protein
MNFNYVNYMMKSFKLSFNEEMISLKIVTRNCLFENVLTLNNINSEKLIFPSGTERTSILTPYTNFIPCK